VANTTYGNRPALLGGAELRNAITLKQTAAQKAGTVTKLGRRQYAAKAQPSHSPQRRQDLACSSHGIKAKKLQPKGGWTMKDETSMKAQLLPTSFRQSN